MLHQSGVARTNRTHNLDDFIDQFDGFLTVRVDGHQDSIDNLQDSIDRMENSVNTRKINPVVPIY